jgi:protein-L-isoaspartate(D-aspartate) O-methyltransferase
MNRIDTFQHQGLRKQLVAILKNKGITKPEVLDAVMRIPRHYFMDSAFLSFAYADQAFPIGSGQTISQPYTVAFQTELLDLKPGMKILEIGTGSGYQTAVLTTMGMKVFSVERQRNLYKTAVKILDDLHSTAKCFYGDGYKGLPAFGPFDRVLVTCGAPHVPPDLLPQMKTGGIMVLPIGEGDSQVMTRLVKQPDGTMVTTTHGDFRFVPMLPDKQAM